MKKVLFSMLVLAAAVVSVPAELIKNGNFDRKINPWLFEVTGPYLEGSEHPWTVAKGVDGVIVDGMWSDQHIHISNLRLVQEVKPIKGKKYRFSMEAKSDTSNARMEVKIGVPYGGEAWQLLDMKHIHAPGHGIDLAPNWQTLTFEFTAKFNRNDIRSLAKELKDAIKRKAEWDKKRQKMERERIRWDARDTQVEIWLGNMTGSAQVKNVSLVEVVE